MAPLKVGYWCDPRIDQLWYPWLKGHGSIKGIGRLVFWHGHPPYPWLKGHGSIKGVQCHKRGDIIQAGIHG